MTRDEILNMPAGREMDYLVAYHVMKQLPSNPGFYSSDVYITRPTGENSGRVDVFKPSTFIGDAWEVVEKLKERVLNFQMIQYAYNRTYATFGKDLELEAVEANGENCTPLAICRAALLAVMQL